MPIFGDESMVATTNPFFTKLVVANNDDRSRGATVLFNSVSDLAIGKPFASADSYRSSWVRFTSVTVPQGATILDAYLILTASGSDAGNTVNCLISGHDHDNTTQIANIADWDGRSKTTATVAWNSMPPFIGDQTYSTPDLKTIVQEIVDRVGWASGNAMSFFLEDNGSTGGEGRLGSQNERGQGQTRLSISYTT